MNVRNLITQNSHWVELLDRLYFLIMFQQNAIMIPIIVTKFINLSVSLQLCSFYSTAIWQVRSSLSILRHVMRCEAWSKLVEQMTVNHLKCWSSAVLMVTADGAICLTTLWLLINILLFVISTTVHRNITDPFPFW